MNIAFLSNTDSSLYLFRLPVMQALLEKGHTIYAICPKGDKNQALRDGGFIVVNYEMSRKSLNPFRELKTIKSIYGAIKDLKLDLLHTFTVKPNIYGTFAAKYAKIPVILNLIEGLGSFYASNSIKNMVVRIAIEKLYKIVFKLSNGCIFVNSDDPQYLIDKKIIPQSRASVIKSVGIDTELFNMENFTKERLEEIKEKNGLKNKVVVFMAARAIWDKGIREFYEACEIVRAKYPHVEFVFVGDIDSGNHTCANREFLQGGSVKWLGHRDDMLELTAISDIYVLPSFYKEGIPRTLLEAASMSKPIVTTDTVGCKEVVDDGENGFLVPIKDARSLADKIEILVNDKELMDKMGQKSRKKALKEFELKKVVKQYLELYEKMLPKDKK
ncbi:MAG: glycosyltransferase family 4 protein [Campylobacteraceae bacterium]|jgi:N,N'-diacetylbacillosaminyl-diphospho-undecaprenol alpha-1,3-N-acetylgalactosaminyltransferase|nr:glycosyltransferase family 4 protein [Campylobacteraceae bacterium]